MKFSLINVSKRNGSKVSGSWIQNVIGTLADAQKRAKDTNAVNSNKLDIAIVEEVSSTTPILEHFTDLTVIA